MMGLSDGRKSFKIGLAVLIQYRRVTDTQPASHPPSQTRCRSKDCAMISRRAGKNLEQWAVTWGMVFNPSKCYIMSVGKGRTHKPHFYVCLCWTRSIKKALEWSCIFSIWNKSVWYVNSDIRITVKIWCSSCLYLLILQDDLVDDLSSGNVYVQ